MLVVRAVGALALPIAMIGGSVGRRRRRGAAVPPAPAREDRDEVLGGEREEDLDDIDLGVDPSGPVATPERPRPTKRELRALQCHPAALRDHDLRCVDLRGWNLAGVDLSGTDLSHARLRRADLRGASLTAARLHYADLCGARARSAPRRSATVLEADLGGADLRDLDLRAVHQLAMCNLRQARTDRTTRWPRGFDPQLAMAPRL